MREDAAPPAIVVANGGVVGAGAPGRQPSMPLDLDSCLEGQPARALALLRRSDYLPLLHNLKGMNGENAFRPRFYLDRTRARQLDSITETVAPPHSGG